MGDPNQLLRIVGASVKLYPDAEQFYHHENVNNLYVLSLVKVIALHLFNCTPLLLETSLVC
jgi:hypothetical protein